MQPILNASINYDAARPLDTPDELENWLSAPTNSSNLLHSQPFGVTYCFFLMESQPVWVFRHILQTTANCWTAADSDVSVSFAVVSCGKAPYIPLPFFSRHVLWRNDYLPSNVEGYLRETSHDRCWHSSTVLMLYDYGLTFAREIELFWQRPRRSWPFVLFVANRYITILGQIPQSISTLWSSRYSDYSVCCAYCIERQLMAHLKLDYSGGPIQRRVPPLTYAVRDQVQFYAPHWSDFNRGGPNYRRRCVIDHLPTCSPPIMNQSYHGHAYLRSLSKGPVSFDLSSGNCALRDRRWLCGCNLSTHHHFWSWQSNLKWAIISSSTDSTTLSLSQGELMAIDCSYYSSQEWDFRFSKV